MICIKKQYYYFLFTFAFIIVTSEYLFTSSLYVSRLIVGFSVSFYLYFTNPTKVTSSSKSFPILATEVFESKFIGSP